ncbi:hypothetical protein V7S43_000108 [Phytophthora oleae]|uniref:Uncharacterized protein n=1 Tax=Phytophthora oleae TaxID=2107226 RepID=A0ABD3G4R6_9STRA
MQRYAQPLEKLMSFAIKSAPVNLAQVWEDKGGNEISYDTIANSFDIAWDGTLERATLYMPPYHQHVMLAFLYPLRDYLNKVSICQISPDYSAAFEWVCVKRFQELFGENSRGCSHVVLPDFFTKQQKFGLCTEVRFAKHTRPMPKITEKGDLQPSLDTQTASPEK